MTEYIGYPRERERGKEIKRKKHQLSAINARRDYAIVRCTSARTDTLQFSHYAIYGSLLFSLDLLILGNFKLARLYARIYML